MKMLHFAKRNAKEILRDPLNLAFGIGFPVILLLLLSAIQANIPVDQFEIDSLTPGMSIFGSSFMTLFSATLIARDRKSAFLERLYTTPMKAIDFILGYTLPMLPIALCQTFVCYLAGLLLGMKSSVHLIGGVICSLPASVFFIALGLLCGSVMNDKQVGGICGAALTNLTAWFSGIWFDLSLVGGWFMRIAECLPFMHAVKLVEYAAKGNYANAGIHFAVICGYAFAVTVFAVMLFLRQMRVK